MPKAYPKLPALAQRRVDGLMVQMGRCNQITGDLEKMKDPAIQLSVDQALRELADVRRWLVDAIECVRIDNGITASGEALIETGVDT